MNFNLISSFIERRRQLFVALIAISVLAFLVGNALLPRTGETRAARALRSAAFTGGLNTTDTGDALDISLYGNYAYIGTKVNTGANPEFFIADISVPTNPQSVGSLEIGSRVNAISAFDRYVYIATGRDSREFGVIMVTDKSTPVEVGNGFDAPGRPDGLSLFVTGTSTARSFDMTSTGTSTAYIGTEENSGGPEFYALDISNPVQISMRGSREIGFDINDIYVVGGRAYLATSNPYGELVVLNVSNPRAIFQEAAYNLPGANGALGLDYTNGKLYVAASNNGASADFFIFNVSDGVLTQIGSINLGSTNRKVKVYAGKAFIATRAVGAALMIVDVRNPSQPALEEVFDAGGARADDVALGPSFVYLATEHDQKELQVIDPLFVIAPALGDRNNDGTIAIVCMGDSNTDAGWWAGPSWCEQLRDLVGANKPARIINQGNGGGTAADLGIIYGVPLYAGYYLPGIISKYVPDAIVFAYGTNDIRFGATVDQTLVAYESHAATTTKTGAKPFIALTPYLNESTTSTINMLYTDLNNRITSTFIGSTTADVIDFNSIIRAPDDYQDIVHMNVAGQAKRARAAYEKLVGQY